MVMGSDGLWDNLTEGEITEITQKALREATGSGSLREMPTKAAQAIAHEALEASKDLDRFTPFARSVASSQPS